MFAYIRKNELSDHTPRNPSVTYDVVVKGNIHFLNLVTLAFKNHDRYECGDREGFIEYCSCRSKSEAETLLDGIKRQAIRWITHWE